MIPIESHQKIHMEKSYEARSGMAVIAKLKKQAKRALEKLADTPGVQALVPYAVQFPDCVEVQHPRTTLELCRELIQSQTRGAYLRFGDGDVFLLTGRDEKYQTANPQLSQEMGEAFNLKGKGIVKALGINSKRFGLLPHMGPGIHQWDDVTATKVLSDCFGYFIGSQIHCNVALAYTAVFDREYAVNFLRFLKSQNPVLFIGNEDVPDEILHKLFGNIERVASPARNSYDRIDEIEQKSREVLKKHNDEFATVIVAMGCSGRPLAKRLYNHGLNIFLFDFGSLLDAFCGWGTRAWIEQTDHDIRDILNEL